MSVVTPALCVKSSARPDKPSLCGRRHTDPMSASTKTYIVVGAGTAGSILTRRLLDAGHEVTLLEAGDHDLNPAIHSVSRLGELWHSAEDWDYFTVPQKNADGRVIHWPRGRVLGGSHALNATIWVRGAAQDYDAWAADGCPGWSWKDVLPWFRAVEAYVPPAGAAPDESRGTDGPVPAVQDYPLNPIFESIIEAAEHVGVPYNADYNAGTLDGVSQQQVNVRDGKRFNTWMAYVKPVAEDPRLTLRTGVLMKKVLIEDSRAVGVAVVPFNDPDGTPEEIRADEVILCAGALDSPKILLRSGIGPAVHLSEVGVPVVHDLPGVGANLHDHLLAPVIAEATSRTIEHPESDWSVTQTHLFWRSRPDLDVPDTQPIHFSVPMYDDGMTGPANAFTLHSGLVRPYSRGTVRLTGPGTSDPVELDPNILADPRDREALLASFRQARAMVAAPPLAEEWGASELYPGPEVRTEEEEIAYINRFVTTYHHQVGTCRMGTSPDAVVSPEDLRVHGIDGLRVVDASVMPRVPSGNTNAPTAMIAERAAALMTADDTSPATATEVAGVGL
ncbi:Alcohol dehydrogenase [acceptor] [Kocuria rosea]|nr:Alcohol dehydrogenase [acceptor] [Kocuria rosea]VEI49656.1 Alcohol dehydrogenase [acceptor] [Kocuria rosea]